MKIKPSNAEMALVSINEYGGKTYDLGRVPHAPETVDSVEPKKRSTGEVIPPDVWDAERLEAHEACGTNGAGQFSATPANVAHMLKLHPYWRGALRLNRMSRLTECAGVPVNATFAMDVQIWFSQNYWCRVTKTDAQDAVEWVAENDSYHPIEQYVLGLPKWDGTDRIAELVARVGATNGREKLYTEYLRKWLTAAIQRVCEPGCKFDNMLVLAGAQGIRKSSFFAALVPERRFFNDSSIDIENTQNLDIVNAAWIHEFAEFESFTSRADVGRLKAFLTTSEDRYRPPYGRSFQIAKRQCVFAGTTNDLDFLRDPTGARRFWVVTLEGSQIDTDWVSEHRDQIWAQAMSLYQDSEPIYLTEEAQSEQSEQSEEYASEDPWEDKILRVTSGQTNVVMSDLLKEFVDTSQASVTVARRIGTVLRKHGWRKVIRTRLGVRHKAWERLEPMILF